jgi:hypothetical protein
MPSGLTKEEENDWAWAMRAPLFRVGDVVDMGDFKVRLLEDSLAHGSPRVKRLDTGAEYYCTMYGHAAIVGKMQQIVAEFRSSIRKGTYVHGSTGNATMKRRKRK